LAAPTVEACPGVCRSLLKAAAQSPSRAVAFVRSDSSLVRQDPSAGVSHLRPPHTIGLL
jgi:hypothetical protein